MLDAHQLGDTQVNSLFDQAESLRRPAILLRAARAGGADYNRNRDLKRLMQGSLPCPAVAVRRLLDDEAVIDARRLAGDAGYSLTRHVAVMIALLAELRLLRLTTAADRAA